MAKTHHWWTEADRRAESPAETAARLTGADSGFPADAQHLVILDGDGRFLGRVDLAWLLPDGRWLLVEVDGLDFHGSRADIVADFHRQNRLITRATMLRRYTGADAVSGRLTTEVGDILRSAGWRPDSVFRTVRFG